MGFTTVSYFTYGGIKHALSLGVPYNSYQDVFIINITTQFLVTFSVWGWILYLTVPGYLIYQLGGFFLSWIFTPQAGEGPESAEDAKRREKMEKKANRPKMKVMR